ncbi:MAG: [protein-PII] uridylyltransferase [Pseudomonadota bacterium]|nr:[protein-PII] uridylyltransferase [Pseudomonadota bacterium]
MSRLPFDQRSVIDRRRLTVELSAKLDGLSDPAGYRRTLLEQLRENLDAGRHAVRDIFRAKSDGIVAALANSFLMDQIIRVAFDRVEQQVFPAINPTAGDRLSLIAVGGYGRAEMAPFSDVDLCFLHPWKLTPRGEQVVEYLLYLLWDLGVTVGHATRSLDESVARAKKDVTICTSLLEARHICGDQSLFTEFMRRFQKEVLTRGGDNFLAAKMSERNDRHAQMGESRYVLEPNIKDGKGGLRDLHTLFWIARYLYPVNEIDDLVSQGILKRDEKKLFEKSNKFLWTVRFHLHYLASRKEDRLTFDQQAPISELMQFGPRLNATGAERFMKYYYRVAKDVGNLTRTFCSALEVEHKNPTRRRGFENSRKYSVISGFKISNGRLDVANDCAFEQKPIRILELFREAQKNGLDVHPNALRLLGRSLARIDAKLRADDLANKIFFEILTSNKEPAIALRRMNESGVLGKFILDFGRVVAQMQHDMYHVYTVDEHTIFAIGILWSLERGDLSEQLPLVTEIASDLLSRNVLYLALFLHDIGKGRGGNHSIIGARIASKLGPRFGLNREDTETVSWLVENHLLLSNTAFKRDIGDSRTVSDFVREVQSLERLRLLLVLTVADIRAVGPKVWNGWKAQLVEGLYSEAAAELSAGRTRLDRRERVIVAQENLCGSLGDWAPNEVSAYLKRGYPSYWLSFDTESHTRHARFIRDADNDGRQFAFASLADPLRSATEVTIYCPDHHGLFSGIAGAMAASGATIADAKVFSTTDGMALDVFWIHGVDGQPYEQISKLSHTIEETLRNDFKPQTLIEGKGPLRDRTKVFSVAPRVLVDNNASATYTVIEVNARDRGGLLYDVTRTLRELRLSIGSARITTYGVRAVDIFYVKDMFGMKVVGDEHIKKIRDTLLEVLLPEKVGGEKQELRKRVRLQRVDY